MNSLYTFLTRRHNLNETLTILMPSLAVGITTRHIAELLDAASPIPAAVSIAAALATVIVVALLVDRRTRG